MSITRALFTVTRSRRAGPVALLTLLMLLAAGLTASLSVAAQDEALPDLPRLHSVSIFPDDLPQYPADYPHWSYVNPDAPVGGRLRLAAQGSYDTLSDFGTGGDTASGIRSLFGENILYDSLLTSNQEEIGVYYGLLAEWMMLAPDRSFIIFKIRDEARFSDGEPITPEDVIFSFEKRIEEGFPGFANAYAYIADMRDLGDGLIRFDFDRDHPAFDRAAPFSVGFVAVMPKHYWQDIDLAEPLLEVPLGSGPYRVGDFEAGAFVEYERNADYWGWDHPANQGRFNFDTIEIAYYGNRAVMRQALKAGDIDFFTEGTMTSWMEDYQIEAVETGLLQRRIVPVQGDVPGPAQAFWLNHRLEKFQDPRVRQALALAFDFESMNRDFFYGAYERLHSYYYWSSDYRAEGPPDADELAILEPFRDQLPAALFTEPAYRYPLSETPNNRDNLARAFALLSEAGYRIEEGVLRDADGLAFSVDMIFTSDAFERIYNRWAEGLERLGIEANIQKLEGAQWVNRVGDWDYEITSYSFGGAAFPGNDLRSYFTSEYSEIPRSYGFAGYSNPVIDALASLARGEQDSRQRLAAITRAADRVMRADQVTILQWYYPYSRFLYWDQLGFPQADSEGHPLEDGVNETWSWWIDPIKAETLPARQAEVFNR